MMSGAAREDEDWESTASESEIGKRDLDLVETQLATEGYREGIAEGRNLGLQSANTHSVSQSFGGCVASSS